MTEQKRITEDEFYEKFEMVTNHIEDNAGWDGCMFETYGDEYKHIVDQHCNNPKVQVWTIMEGDDDTMFIESGLYLVNRMGYLITDTVPEGVAEGKVLISILLDSE